MNAELNINQINAGMKIRIKSDATFADFHVPGYGTLVEPVIRKDKSAGRIVTVRAIYIDKMEDEHGNLINEYAIDTTAGMYPLEKLELI